MREANITVGESGFEAMGIGELVSLARDAGILDFEELACHGSGAVVQVEVESPMDEEALSNLEYVDRCEHVTETNDGQLYVIEFTAPELPEGLAERADDLVGTCDPELDGGDATMSLVGPQETIADTIRGYEAAGVRPDLRRLGTYEGRPRVLDGLTDRQREVIQTAYELGYYEVPRSVSTRDVAAELGVDPSTVAEHLQRAERNVMRQLL